MLKRNGFFCSGVLWAVVLALLLVSVAWAGDRGGLLGDFLDGPMKDVREVVFAVRQPGVGGHWYENFGYYSQDDSRKLYRAKGQLCVLDLVTGQVRTIFEDLKGSVRDPAVHHSGRKVLFSYRKAGSDCFHLYEINLDGSGLRQLTDGPFDDMEPAYLPDGGIFFISSRCKRWVNCWYCQVATLHRCEADGSNITEISANIEQDNTPWPLPDGRVIYQRWEYVDRSRVGFHHLWTCNPDGTGQMVYYGNMHPETVMLDAKPISGSDNVVAIFSPGHGKSEHRGAVTIVSPKCGPDDLGSAVKITSDEEFRDPWGFSTDCFMAAKEAALYVMNASGKAEEVYRLPNSLAKSGAWLHEPRPIVRERSERPIPQRVHPASDTGRLILADVYNGRRMEGVKRGDIKKLLVLETLPKPINFTGKMPPVSFGGTFTLVRILGTVPVEADGSAYMEVPAKRSLFFVALDENDNSVKRMQSFLTVMPGETTSCLGCHEQRTKAPINRGDAALGALMKPVSRIEPIADIPEVIDYPRDIQPIWDEHCISCHDYDQRAGGVILTADRGPIYSHSYFVLTQRQEFTDGRDAMHTNLPPRAIGTSASPLMKRIDGSHRGVKVTKHQEDLIRYWIEVGAPYPGTYAALGTGMIGGFPKSQLDTSDRKWPQSQPAAEAIERRCLSCHDSSLPLPKYLSDNLGLVLSNPDITEIRVKMSRHIMFNLTRPEKSLILLAPLAMEQGGYALCKTREGMGETVVTFDDTSDPDYQKILALCVAGKRYLDQIKRFDMPGFTPRPEYVREMKRFGIVPPETPTDAVDPYAADRVYWESLWYRPDTVK